MRTKSHRSSVARSSKQQTLRDMYLWPCAVSHHSCPAWYLLFVRMVVYIASKMKETTQSRRWLKIAKSAKVNDLRAQRQTIELLDLEMGVTIVTTTNIARHLWPPSIVQHPLTTQIFSADNWYARFVKCCSAAIWAKAHTCKYEATTLSHRCALLITEMCGRHRAHITQKQSHKPHSQSLLTYMADLLNWSTRV